ncbi:MAG: NAD(P)H-dependent oxidoreductase [Winogradskyella sp.]|nr:NAD(P)H-dependent oxidoreductase [Winogradskyella sp.]
MDIIKQLKWRYATKKFDSDKNLSENQILTIKNAFNLTATSFGLQTISLIVIKDKLKRKDLVGHSYNQKQVLEASHLLIICIQNDIHTQDVNAYYDNIKNIRNTPETILEPYKQNLIKTVSAMSIPERQQWSKNQAYIALGNLMTVCAIEGIDACPMEGFNPAKYDELLELDKKGLKSVLLLPVGFRAEDDIFSQFEKVRKPLERTILEL